MKTKRIALALVLTAAVFLMVPAAAMANMAIHGNYVQDDDACAGCHRAHTSVSSITWQETGSTAEHSALLVSSATEVWEFCYACHDATSQGAETNVQTGIYEGTLYGNQNSVLNGGGFESLDQSATTSSHQYQGSSWGAFGGGYFGDGANFSDGTNTRGQGPDAYGNGTGNAIKMTCTSCHDPHGSPNYRILKTFVNGNAVGKYGPGNAPGDTTDLDPNGFVSSVETGWPINGFRLRTEYPGYQPDYTTARYAKGYNMTDASETVPAQGVNASKGMSGWCAGCHSTYLGNSTEVFTKTNAYSVDTTYQSLATTYNAGDGRGLGLRHKHPVNVALATYNGPDKASMVITDTTLPLAHAINEQGNKVNESSDWIECLTCHVAHGTKATMSGWASNAGAASIVDTDNIARSGFVVQKSEPSALLRFDNRGVCERCHNK